MTTEAMRDPVIEAWSDNLEEGLVDTGMDQASARAYRQAFELGLTRVISQTATRQELQDGLAQVRVELKESAAQGRQELQEVRVELKESAAQGRQELQEVRAELKEGLAQGRQELQDGLAQVRIEMQDGLARVRVEIKEMGAQLRVEMQGIQDQLQREMDQRFGDMQKRLNLLTWVVGLGFTGMFGLMTAMLIRL